MANPRRKKPAAGKAAPKKAAPRRKSSAGGPPLWLIFTGLIAAGVAIYFFINHKTPRNGAEPLQQKVSQMAAENPDAEIFQLKEEPPVPKVVEKKK